MEAVKLIHIALIIFLAICAQSKGDFLNPYRLFVMLGSMAIVLIIEHNEQIDKYLDSWQ